MGAPTRRGSRGHRRVCREELHGRQAALGRPSLHLCGNAGQERHAGGQRWSSRVLVMPGLTRNWAPAWMAASACAGVGRYRHQPKCQAPRLHTFERHEGALCPEGESMSDTAVASARAMGTACRGSSMVTTGMTGETCRMLAASAMVDLVSQAVQPVGVDNAVPVDEEVGKPWCVASPPSKTLRQPSSAVTTVAAVRVAGSAAWSSGASGSLSSAVGVEATWCIQAPRPGRPSAARARRSGCRDRG